MPRFEITLIEVFPRMSLAVHLGPTMELRTETVPGHIRGFDGKPRWMVVVLDIFQLLSNL